jgi:polar amino acid transport system substrate-binding protein
MKRPSRLMLFLAIVASFLIGCAGAASPSPAAQSPAASPSAAGSASPSTAPSASPIAPPTSLITPGKVTDCVDIEYPPMEMFPSTSVTDPNQAVGFDVEGAQAVAKAWNLPLTIRNVGFDALIPDLSAGRCDLVWTALYISDARLKIADAVPYMATGWVVMVPVGNPEAIKTKDDLCGKKVSIQTGGQVEIEIKNASQACTTAGKPAITVAGYPKVADEFQQIVLGRVDAVWETDSAVLNFQFTNPGKYDNAFAFPKDRTYGVYFQKNKPDVKAALQAALLQLKTDGTLANLATKYKIDPTTLDAIK